MQDAQFYFCENRRKDLSEQKRKAVSQTFRRIADRWADAVHAHAHAVGLLRYVRATAAGCGAFTDAHTRVLLCILLSKLRAGAGGNTRVTF